MSSDYSTSVRISQAARLESAVNSLHVLDGQIAVELATTLADTLAYLNCWSVPRPCVI